MRSYLRPAFCIGLCLAAVSPANPVLAQAATSGAAAPSTPASSQAQTGDSKFIQDIGNQAISAVSDKSQSQTEKQQKYRQILQSAFDMQTIGKFVLGRYWNTATPEQQ